MPDLSEIRARALGLPEEERMQLAEALLLSLSSDQPYEIEGISEALRRDAEMTADPSCSLTFEEVAARMHRRFESAE